MLISRSVLRSLLACVAASSLLVGCHQQSVDNSKELSKEVLSGAPNVAINLILSGLAEHDGSVLWKAMPKSYQEDVNEIVQLASSKLDGEIYDSGFKLVSRVVEVVDLKQEFVFNTTLGERPPEEEIAEFKKAWPSIANLVSTLAESPIGSVEGLKSFDGAKFFEETLSAVLKDIDSLSKLAVVDEQMPISSYKDAVVSLIEGGDSTAMLEIKLPNGVIESSAFKKVDDRWVPQDLALDWTARIAQAKAQLEAVDPMQLVKQKPQILNIIAMVDGILTQIEGAETQEQFDRAVQGAILPLIGLIFMGQGLGGSGGGVPPVSLQ